MLTQIHIRDLATIAEVKLELQHGCTMITGETGAGKSVFIEAIELALGGRASQNLVRPGKEKADISLCFDITDFPKVIAYLKESDLYQEGPECIIRRIITSDGRSRCYVNGSPSTLQLVKELGELLFHLHGQHEQQVLLKADTQREMLDRYADQIPLTQEIKILADDWREKNLQIKTLRMQLLERKNRSDYLRFHLDELQALNLNAGEWEQLEAEHHRVSNAESLMHTIQYVIEKLSHDDEQGMLSFVHENKKALETICGFEPKAQEWVTTLNTINIQIQDLESELRNYLESIDLDPESIQQLETRVSMIFDLSRKHKVSPTELVTFRDQLHAEFMQLESGDETLSQLEKEQSILLTRYQLLADKLTAARRTAANKLEKEITQTIRSLSLPHGAFQIAFETTNETEPCAHGKERIVFLIKTNPDQSLQPLHKVISGGELSRLSLAAHLSLANKTTIPTLVFDEVDTGLSGATAEKIGKLLRTLGQSYQVFCVTHQPQVAACAHHHLLVEKYFIDKKTHTRLRLLQKEEQTKEIARMLGGEKITEKTLDHAREVLERVS